MRSFFNTNYIDIIESAKQDVTATKQANYSELIKAYNYFFFRYKYILILKK